MVHDAFELEHFVAYTCEWYGPVIIRDTSLALFEDRSNVGFLPILMDLSWIEGLLDRRRIGAMSAAKSFNSLVGTISGPMAFLAFNFWSSVLTPLTETLMPAIGGYGLAPTLGMLSRTSSLETLQYWLFKICALPLLDVSSLPFLPLRGGTPTWPRFLALFDFHSFSDGLPLSSSKRELI